MVNRQAFNIDGLGWCEATCHKKLFVQIGQTEFDFLFAVIGQQKAIFAQIRFAAGTDHHAPQLLVPNQRCHRFKIRFNFLIDAALRIDRIVFDQGFFDDLKFCVYFKQIRRIVTHHQITVIKGRTHTGAGRNGSIQYRWLYL